MSGLPEGWESDYDGHRWFYRFKPTGQTQFQFPKEGDEFPDFIDDRAPAPALAPEERLESQQQVKRRITTAGDDVKPATANNATRMRATAGPLGAGLGFGGPGLDDNDDDDGGTFYYQPESFMFLGPGAYSNVSPMADEDDREEAGANDAPRGRSSRRAESADRSSKVSPIQSEATTPLVIKSEPLTTTQTETKDADGPADSAAPAKTTALPVAPSEATVQQSVSPPPPPPPPAVQIEAHELPASTHYSPVGVIAEMPTEHTAQARIETHPDPVEMGDSSVLAPIEVRTAALQIGIAELAEHTSPVEPKSLGPPSDELLQQTSMPEHLLQQATFGTQARPQTVSSPSSSPNPSKAPSTPSGEAAAERPAHPTETAPLAPAKEPQPRFTIARKPTNAGAKPGPYHAYSPGASTTAAQPPAQAPDAEPDRRRPAGDVTDASNRDKRASLLSREGSLMLGQSSSNTVASQMPSVLQPPNAPASAQSPVRPAEQAYAPYADAASSLASANTPPAAASDGNETQPPVHQDNTPGLSLSHVPSVLKIGPRRPAPAAATTVAGSQQQQAGLPQPSTPMLGNHIAYQQAQPPGHSFNDRAEGARTAPPPQTTSRFPAGQVPQSMAPGFIRQQRLAPRPGVQRVQSEPIDPPYPVTPRQQPILPVERRATDQMIGDQMAEQPVQSPQDRSRQESFGSSDVSSLDPLSRTQTAGSVQTPSPLDDGRRIPSNASGFFSVSSMDISSPSSASDIHSQVQSPMSQAGRRRDSGGRSASFSSSAEPQAGYFLSSAPLPPAVPDKVPLPRGTNDKSTERRHSMPPQQAVQPPPPPPKEVAGPVQSPSQPVQWQQPQNGITMRPTYQVSGHHVSNGQDTQTQGRPQRPVVVPPFQQQGHRLSMSTPMSPGHHLHAIEESPESEQSFSSLPRPGVRVGQPQQQQSPQHHQTQQRSPQNPGQPTPLAFSGPPGVHQSSGQTASPAGANPPAGSAVPPQPWQMAPPNPAQTHQRTISSPAYGQRPGAGPEAKRDEKKEKGSWLSKLKKTTNKPAVLQKPPPALMQQFQPQQVAYGAQQQGFPQQQQQQHQQQQHWSTYPTQPSPDQRWAGQQGGASPNDSPRRPSEGVSPTSHASPFGQSPRVSSDGRQAANSPLSNDARSVNSMPPQAQSSLPSAAPGPPGDVELNRNASSASTYAASISTVDISEAQAQPVLKGHLVSVRKPPGAAPNQQAQQWQSSSQGQQQQAVWPPGNAPGTPVDRSYVVPPLFSSSKEAAAAAAAQEPTAVAGGGRAYPRDSVVSTVSYHDPRASIVSAISAEDLGQGNSSRWQRPAPDYSGDSWGEDEWRRR